MQSIIWIIFFLETIQVLRCHTCQVLRFRHSHYGFPEKLKTTAVLRNDYGFTLGWGCTFLVTIWTCLAYFSMNSWVWVNTADPQTSSVFVSETMDCNRLRISARREQYPPPRALELLRSGNYSLFALRSYTHEGKPRGSIMSAPPAKKRPIWSVQQYKEQWIKLYKF